MVPISVISEQCVACYWCKGQHLMCATTLWWVTACHSVPHQTLAKSVGSGEKPLALFLLCSSLTEKMSSSDKIPLKHPHNVLRCLQSCSHFLFLFHNQTLAVACTCFSSKDPAMLGLAGKDADWSLSRWICKNLDMKSQWSSWLRAGVWTETGQLLIYSLWLWYH